MREIGTLVCWATLSKYDIDIEKPELVEIFIDTPVAATGKYVELDNCVLEVEKSVKSANDIREIEAFNITEDCKIFICYDRMEYFFSAVTGEYQKYEKLIIMILFHKQSTNLIEIIM